MQKKMYLEQLSDVKIDQTKVRLIENIYKTKLPEYIKRIISNCDETIFFDKERMLSFNEIANAETDLHVNFVGFHLIPLVDCMNNDFIVYNFENDSWSKFNIIEECTFKKRASFEEVFN